MKNIELRFSLFFIFAGITLIGINSISKITGNTIGNTASSLGISLFGFLPLILGIVLFMMSQKNEGGLEKGVKENLASIIKKSGKIIDKSKELRSIAIKCGYSLKPAVKEGYPVYTPEGKYLAVIPIHKVTYRTSKDIINALASGKPQIKSGYH